MHFTIEKILEGDREILVWYKNALKLWDEILDKYKIQEDNLISELAKELWNYQLQFEHECGGRTIGQEVMVVSGIAQFYSTDVGFDIRWGERDDYRFEKARNLYTAIQQSMCSVEVKGYARDVARSYGLEEEWR